MVTYYRVHYTQGPNIFGSFDMTQEHVEVANRGSIDIAIIDSGFDLTFRHITNIEKIKE